MFFAPKAKAFESPLQKILNFSQGKKSSPDKKGEKNDLQLASADSSRKKNKIEQQKDGRVPEVVSDPREIEEAAEFAANATGVRKDFLMGMLVVESNLGRNPGTCTYREVEEGALESYESGQLSSKAWQTFKQRQTIIKEIAKNLGYDHEKLLVSCNPGEAYAGTGGAMGVPQFMPDTWLAYKDEIAAIVGKENPDPWNVKDGTVAMALLVADTPGVTDHSIFAERNAAKMYLSGTTSSQYDWYANKILYWAQNYTQLLMG